MFRTYVSTSFFSFLSTALIMLMLAFLSSCGDSGSENDPSDDSFENRPSSMIKPNLPTETRSFELGTATYQLSLPKDRQLYQTFQEETHSYAYQGSLPRNWREDYYAMFVEASEDEDMIRHINAQLKSLQPQATPDELVELTVAFVQGSIDYDWETYHNIDKSTIRYPYETLYKGTGVCADKTILLAKLLMEQGYDLAIFSFEKANHMALGLKVPSEFGMYNTSYTFVEATGYAPIGRIPRNYVGGIKLENNPDVVPLTEGGKVFHKIRENRRLEKEEERLYGTDYLFMNAEQKRLKKEMTALSEELADLKKQLKGCSGTVSPEKFKECKEVERTHNEKVNEFNGLVDRFNRISNEKNRPAA